MRSNLQLERPRNLRCPLAAFALTLSLVALGCTPEAPEDRAAISEAHDQTLHVDWFEGDVEAAFDRASQLGKPVFLYWGAEWCPPCHYLKNKVY